MNNSVKQFARHDTNVISSEKGNDRHHMTIQFCLENSNYLDARLKKKRYSINGQSGDLSSSLPEINAENEHTCAQIVSTPSLRYSSQLLPAQGRTERLYVKLH